MVESGPPPPPPDENSESDEDSISENEEDEDSQDESEDSSKEASDSEEELPPQPIPKILTSQFMTLSLDPGSYEFLMSNLEQLAAAKRAEGIPGDFPIPSQPVFMPPEQVPEVPDFDDSDSEDDEIPIPNFAPHAVEYA